jgi:hypothetical protein
MASRWSHSTGAVTRFEGDTGPGTVPGSESAVEGPAAIASLSAFRVAANRAAAQLLAPSTMWRWGCGRLTVPVATR